MTDWNTTASPGSRPPELPLEVQDLVIEKVCYGLGDESERLFLEHLALLGASMEAEVENQERAVSTIELATIAFHPASTTRPSEFLVKKIERTAREIWSRTTLQEAARLPMATRPIRLRERAAWALAAASLLLAITGWWPRLSEQRPALPATPRVAETSSTTPDTAIRPAVAKRWDLASPTSDASLASQGPTGEVLWDPERHVGELHLRGLVANDPAIERYQLWIFDAERDERYPVDGGLFDVSGDGEVVVPFEAGLSVSQPTLFAITVERPQGVVVSDRERIVLVGQTG